jgi:uncharacterized protein YgiM (DUF1202 family)
VAFVRADLADVRSGPGKKYYATAQLAQGTPIEVYRDDPGGWLAIRPPEGSFSWVLARQLRMTNQPNLAEVIDQGAVAWVGAAAAERLDHKWQVRLDRGELVEVLGSEQLATTSGAVEEPCYKIAPPAGEFRWVRQSDVSHHAVNLVDHQVRVHESEVVEAEDKDVDVDHPEWDGSDDDSRFESSVADSEVEQPAGNKSDKSIDGMAWRKRNVRKADAGSATNSASASESAQEISTSAAGDAGTDFDAELSKLDVELSLMVSREPVLWKLDSLREQAEKLIGHVDSDAKRNRTRLLLDKIAEFQALQRRRENLARDTSDIDSSTQIVVPPAPDSDEASPQSPRQALFDGSGWLMPVHSQNRASPPYALMSDDGKLLQYVTPAPGLNLRRYLRQKLGLYGQRGYIPELQLAHLTAQRVVVLKRHID